jgi:hypothetical protein
MSYPDIPPTLAEMKKKILAGWGILWKKS